MWIGMIALSFFVLIWDIKRSIRPLNFQPFTFGYPNMITCGRLMLLLGFVLFHQNLSSITLFWAFTIIILLDGLDGLVARKMNQCSERGEQFDAETDAQLVWLLSWIHYYSGHVDWWILIPGSLRYTYQLIFFWAPSAPDIPPKRIRATIAVIFFFSLSFSFILSSESAEILLGIAGGLILLSFGLSLYGGLKTITSRLRKGEKTNTNIEIIESRWLVLGFGSVALSDFSIYFTHLPQALECG